MFEIPNHHLSSALLAKVLVLQVSLEASSLLQKNDYSQRAAVLHDSLIDVHLAY